MTKNVNIKTDRTKYGYATAKLSRFPNYSTNRWNYSFSFYSDKKFFDTYQELRNYVESKYSMLDHQNKEYHLPEKRVDFFN